MWKHEHMGHGRPRYESMNCSCGGSCHSGRRFLTKEERIEMLEDYKNWLEKEKQGVEERIEELKK
ncbi:MAG: hypothetical protein AMQ22_01162 [Candidatus Methanofastidiosum methylothiophilum]|uniref:DUF5320 domain-containing protein n=1 Tax=Candidatus Methanofastidiosum methylothiophilum TaxID=1705564 RepID=A0A150J3Q2_9EURY|nr:MAG: hypothetical protein AMQ22_01162 [Candidatus Methanofastidiosum methylthiophilus]